jgi:mono/diheme cytochrome c family protein
MRWWTALFVVVLASCGVRRPDDTMIDARYRGPVRSRNIARGRNRYEVVCVPCHGDHSERQGPLLFRLHWYAPEIRHQVREGNSLMPAIPQHRLSDEDLEHLLAFFLTTGACDAEPTEESVNEESADEARGLDAPWADPEDP